MEVERDRPWVTKGFIVIFTALFVVFFLLLSPCRNERENFYFYVCDVISDGFLKM